MLRVTAICGVGACAWWLLKRRWSRQLNPAQWQYKLAVITGCDSGVGYSAALHLHQQGLTVVAAVLNADSSGANELTRLGQNTGRMKVIVVDVTKHEQIEAAVESVRNILDKDMKLKLHVLINNAGVMVFGETEWQTKHTVNIQVDVNLRGAINVTRLFAPLLRKHKGRIINVSSHCAVLPLPGLAVYAASKAGLQAWSDALRSEWAKYGVKVVSFVPGAFFQQTNILSCQQQHAEEMQKEMSEEALQFYGQYFQTYQNYLSGLAGVRPATAVQSTRFYHMLDSAVLSVTPQAYYHDTPWRYSIYHTLASIVPTRVRDELVNRFTAMPVFQPK